MAQLTLYIDEGTLRKIESAAKRERTSISQWVKNRIVRVLSNKWPENYFNLMGSLRKEKFDRPGRLSFVKDSKREQI